MLPLVVPAWVPATVRHGRFSVAPERRSGPVHLKHTGCVCVGIPSFLAACLASVAVAARGGPVWGRMAVGVAPEGGQACIVVGMLC